MTNYELWFSKQYIAENACNCDCYTCILPITAPCFKNAELIGSDKLPQILMEWLNAEIETEIVT